MEFFVPSESFGLLTPTALMYASVGGSYCRCTVSRFYCDKCRRDHLVDRLYSHRKYASTGCGACLLPYERYVRFGKRVPKCSVEDVKVRFKAPVRVMPPTHPIKYPCQLCKANHRYTSEIGRKHCAFISLERLTVDDNK